MGLLEQRLGYNVPAPPEPVAPQSTPLQSESLQMNVSQSIPETQTVPAYFTKNTEPILSETEDDILTSVNKKRKPEKKEQIKQQIAELDEQLQSIGFTEEQLEAYNIKEAHNARIKERNSRRLTVVISSIFILASIYLLFLIYGVFMTNYRYDDNGNIKPVVLSVEEIREKKNFDKILVSYEQCRILYESILTLDYRLAQGVENPTTLAPEYEKILDDVNTLSVKINALDAEIKYETLKNMLMQWVSTDSAVYLQKISTGILQNNQDDANVAIQYKSIMYDDFSLITQNIVTIGDKTAGTDITNIKNWSPEKYIDEQVKGK